MIRKEFSAKWICSSDFLNKTPLDVFHKERNQLSKPERHPEKLRNYHMKVRKTFKINSLENSYFIDITADDYYKLYINGKFAGQGPSPGYHFNYYVNRFEIGKFLKKGLNVISVHVYYQGLINRVWNSGDLRQGLIAELYSGNNIVLITDSTWKYIRANEYLKGKIIGYKTQYLENIDNRLKIHGWKEIGYNDSGWENCEEKCEVDYNFYMQPTPNISAYNLRPKSIKQIGKNNWLLDFGKEITGNLSICANGNEGDRIRIRYGEECEISKGKKTSRVRYKMRCNCEYQEKWILSGFPGENTDFFDYKAFRYAEIYDPKNVADIKNCYVNARHYPYKQNISKFSSSNKLLDKIWEICEQTIKTGTQEGYLDCPSREKGQYLGDMLISAQAHLYLSGDNRLWGKALYDFSLSSKICPGLMAVCPGSYMQEIADYSLLFPLQLLIYYNHTGDKEFLIKMYPLLIEMKKYFKNFEREDGLISNLTEKWNLVDWPENLRDNYDFGEEGRYPSTCHNVINAMYFVMLENIESIEEVLGINESLRSLRIKKAYNEAFFDKNTGLYKDNENSKNHSLHSNLMALYSGMTGQGGNKNIIDMIRTKRMSCGVYMAYFLLKGLSRSGEYELLYDLLTSDDEKSWGNMIKEGATSCFEAWGKEQKWNTSLCHPWACSPVIILIEDIFGISPGIPGWKKILFNPRIPQNAGEIKLEIPVNTGKITMEYRNGKCKITGPENISIITL